MKLEDEIDEAAPEGCAVKIIQVFWYLIIFMYWSGLCWLGFVLFG